MTEFSLRRACFAIRWVAGLALAVVMGMFLAGALVVQADVRTHLPIFTNVGFNTAISLMLAGMALLLPRQRWWLGGLVAVISALVLTQYFVAWLPSDGIWRIVLNVDGRVSSWSGHMAPLSAFSLLSAGLALAWLERPRNLPGQILLQAVPLLILTAVVGGILNRHLDGLLFAATLDRFAIMSLPTMAALSVFVAGYVAAMLETSWLRDWYSRREDRQAMIIGLAGFAVVLLLGGAASVAVLGGQIQTAVKDELSKTAQTQAAIFPLVVSSALKSLNGRFDGSAASTDLPSLLNDLAGTEGAAWLERGDGPVRLHAGRSPATSQFRLRLKSANPAWLIRDRKWLLEMHLSGAQGQETIVVQQPLPVLDTLFARTSADVAGGVESRLCERAGQENMVCFPSPLMSHSLRVPMLRNNQYAPMWHALNGQRGVVVASDYRGVLVVAAYAPIPELGLGLVRKIDAEMMYQPIRAAVWQALMIMAIIGLLAALLIYWRVRRVVRRAIETSRQLSGLLDVLPVGVWVTDASGRFILCNPAGRRIWAREDWTGAVKCCECKGSWHATGERLEPDDWAIARAIEWGEISLDEVIDIECFDGSHKIISNSALPLHDEEGAIIGGVVVCKDITEPRQTMDALQQSRKSLAEAQRIGRMGSWELNLETGLLVWSDEIFRIFEIDSQCFGASYEAFLALIHPEDRDRVNDAYAESLKKRIPYEIEHRLRFLDGRIKHVRERCETVYGEDGKPLKSIGTVQDVTEYTLAMEDILRLEREFSSLADHLPDIVSRFDRDLRRIYVNPEIEHATGMSREFLLGKTHAELGLPDKVTETWTNALRRVFFTGESEMFEFEIRTKSDVIKYYHTRVVPECDASGMVESVLAIAHDISILKGAETVLRESEERLHGITTNVPGMVFQCFRHAGDGALQFTYISNGARWLLGLDAAALQQDVKAFTGCIIAEDAPSFRTSMLQSQASLCLWNWEGRLVTAEGELRWINLRATPRRLGEDRCMWDGVAINITESKTGEEKLIQSKHMLRELSAHLESVREEERKRIAREIHDELGQTLTALRMDVSLARLGFGESSPPLMARLQSMTQLVDHTIKTARHVTSSLRPGALDLGIVAALEWLVEEFIEHTGIPCELVLGDGDITLNEFTATAVFRITQESLTNIARHAGASQVEIIVTRSDDRLCFEVRDNGTGFDPDAVTSRKSFGLVGMRERVAMMDGDFELDSKPGQGTRIRVCVLVA